MTLRMVTRVSSKSLTEDCERQLQNDYEARGIGMTSSEDDSSGEEEDKSDDSSGEEDEDEEDESNEVEEIVAQQG